jgi:hypothetical protein
MGLGSKSPFSVVSSFTTISYFNGKKHTFLNFKNEQDIPSISLISSSDTDERNGLEISFIVPKDVCSKFFTEIDYVFHPFDVAPNVYFATNNFFSDSGYKKIDVSKHIVDLDGLKIIFANIEKLHKSTWNYYSGLSIKMGNVFYDAPRELTQNTGFCGFDFANCLSSLATKNQQLFPFRAYIEVDIGDIDISTSREEVQKTSRTERAINACLERFFSKRTKRIEEVYQTSNTDIEKCTKLNAMPEKYLSPDFFEKWIRKGGGRDQSIDILYSDFSNNKNFNFAIVNKAAEVGFAKSGKEWNLLRIPDAKIFSSDGFSKDRKRSRQSEEILDFSANFVTVKYSAGSYNKKYSSRKDHIKNMLIALRDEPRGYLDKIKSVVDDYSVVITVTNADDVQKIEDFLTQAQYFNFESIKTSQIQFEKIAKEKRVKTQYQYSSLSINCNSVPLDFTEEVLLDNLKSGQTLLYLLFDGRSTKIFKSENSVNFSVTRETVERELRYAESDKFFKLISDTLGLKHGNLFNHVVLVPESRKDKFIAKLSSHGVICKNLFSFFEENSNDFSVDEAYYYFLNNTFTTISNIDQNEIDDFCSSSKEKLLLTSNFFKKCSDYEKWRGYLPTHHFFTNHKLFSDTLEALKSDNNLHIELAKLVQFRVKKKYITSMSKDLSAKFSSFDVSCPQVVEFQNYLLSL